MSNPIQAAVSNSLLNPVRAAQDAIDHFQAVFDRETADRDKHERLRDLHQQNADEAQRAAGVWIHAKQILADALPNGGDQ